GYRLRQARAALPTGSVGVVDGDLGVARLRGRRLRPQVARDGSRQPDDHRRRGVVLLGRAHHLRPGAAAARWRPDPGGTGPRRSDGGVPRAHVSRRRRRGGRHLARRPARLVGRVASRDAGRRGKRMKFIAALAWIAVALIGAFAVGVLALWRGETVNAVWFVIAAVAVYAIAYRFYGAFLAAKLFALDASRQ